MSKIDVDTKDCVEDQTFEADPKWLHECAKEILNKINVPYDVWKMYDIVRVLKKYEENFKDK